MIQPSRRDFLKTSTVAAAGAGLLASLSSGAYAAGDDEVRIGLIGCGGRGSGAAAQALSTTGKVNLVAVGDAFRDQLDSGLSSISNAVAGNADARVSVDEEHKFTGFDAYQKVIDSDVDLVILATPPGFRPIHFEYAVKQGKHVFMEKPVATDAPGVRRVLDAAREAKEKNLKVGVGLQRRHEKVYLDFVQRLHDGICGDILAMRVYWNGGGVWDPRRTREQCQSEMEYQMRNWYYYNWLCGDHICEQHIHNLDVGNWVKQAFPVSAEGMGGRQVRTDKKYGQIYDHHAVEYTYADGAKMYSYCRHIPNCWNTVTEHGHGTKGEFSLSNNAREAAITVYGGESMKFKDKNNQPYQVEHDDLFRAIRENIEYSEAEYGAMSTMTSILGRMCTYSGKQIMMDDALLNGESLMPATFAWDADPPVLPNDKGEYPIAVPGVTSPYKA